MDIITLFFIVMGFASVIGGFLLEGGHLSGLLAPSALLIIVGGTIGATGVSFPWRELAEVPKMLRVVIQDQKYDYRALMERMKAMCIQVRQSGLLSLESQIDSEPDSLMRKGMRLIVDGTSPTYTRKALELTLQVIEDRHLSRARIFEAAGGYSPTMGIIGTVLGLVHVLGNLEDPDTLGPKIAMAFIATLYGISLANLFWLPIGNKLKEKNRMEILYKSMIIEGLLLIQEGVNTNYMEEKLSSFVAEAELLKSGGRSSNIESSGETRSRRSKKAK